MEVVTTARRKGLNSLFRHLIYFNVEKQNSFLGELFSLSAESFESGVLSDRWSGDTSYFTVSDLEPLSGSNSLLASSNDTTDGQIERRYERETELSLEMRADIYTLSPNTVSTSTDYNGAAVAVYNLDDEFLGRLSIESANTGYTGQATWFVDESSRSITENAGTNFTNVQKNTTQKVRIVKVDSSTVEIFLNGSSQGNYSVANSFGKTGKIVLEQFYASSSLE